MKIPIHISGVCMWRSRMCPLGACVCVCEYDKGSGQKKTPLSVWGPSLLAACCGRSSSISIQQASATSSAPLARLTHGNRHRGNIVDLPTADGDARTKARPLVLETRNKTRDDTIRMKPKRRARLDATTKLISPYSARGAAVLTVVVVFGPSPSIETLLLVCV